MFNGRGYIVLYVVYKVKEKAVLSYFSEYISKEKAAHSSFSEYIAKEKVVVL